MGQSYIGIDIIEISRVREVISRWGDRFMRRIYTAAELELYRCRVESLAVRFAGKEAAIKALSSPVNIVTWQEIEILSGSDGKPFVNLFGLAREQALNLGLRGLEITLSHSRDNAIALVIGIRED
jgi:holo-[acyl-carrier protein] synthase